MSTNTSSRKNDRAALKAYLQQYHLALLQKNILERRREQISVDLASTADIDARIKRQQENLARILSDIMDVIDLLPPNSPGRAIVEMRHIDCMSWTKIADSLYMSRSNAFNCYESALDELLKSEHSTSKIRKIAFKSPKKH